MTQPSFNLLRKLLNAWQRNPTSSRKTTLPINPSRASAYYATISPDAKEQLHASLKNAEAEGCVILEWGKRAESHLLKRIILVDGRKLARFLDEEVAQDIADAARAVLESCLASAPDWLWELKEIILNKWARNQPAYNMAPGQIDSAKQFLVALAAVGRGEQSGLDLRTFSARLLGDSKAMERIRARFASAWNQHYDTGLDPVELYESLGLLKFPPPLFLKGPLRISVGGVWIDFSVLPSYLALPPDIIDGVEFAHSPDYVLTIENLASYNRHIREVQDNGLVIYTAGFLGPASAEMLCLLDRQTPKETPFYHWGDIDAGGLKILNHLQGLLRRSVGLHLMTTELLFRCGKQDSNGKISSFERLNHANAEARLLAMAILDRGEPWVLEQENIDPKSPV